MFTTTSKYTFFLLLPPCSHHITLLFWTHSLSPLQSHRGCTPQSKETKSRLHKANDNAVLKAQEFSRSINSQERPSPVILPKMLKPRLASTCLLGLCIWLKKCQYQEKDTLTTCYKQHALVAYGLLHCFAFPFHTKGILLREKRKRGIKALDLFFFLGRTKNPTNLQKKLVQNAAVPRDSSRLSFFTVLV